MISSAFSLFRLRELPFERFDFSHWQSFLAISLIGLLTGLDPGLRAESPGVSPMPLWLAILGGVVMVWVGFLVILAILRWWMKRGGRWDGQGDLFNLVAASWLVADALGAGLTAVGLPMLLVLPLWLYSVWVGGNALSGAIPRASLSYSIGGIVIGLILATLASVAFMGGLGFALVTLGL